MTYNFLAPHLHSYADAAKKFFRVEKGVSGFKKEESIEPHGEYRPTLSALSKDFHHICIEVSESAYTNTLDAWVLDFRNRAVPVKLYIAMPQGSSKANLQQVKQAMRNGVGVLEVDEFGGNMISEALSQSLTGLRPIEFQRFPAKYRAALSDGFITFLNGNPAKGCSMIYDEIEALTRRIAKKTHAGGFLRVAPTVNLNSGSWGRVTENLMEHLDNVACGCPALKKVLLARVYGITSHRNESGHKIHQRSALVRRDKELRTRFETAYDLLEELAQAAKPLHL